ncbi:hypothetical protein Tco_0435576 [Tanacetum coccineum]
MGTGVDLGGVVWKDPPSVSSSTFVEVKRSGSDSWAPKKEAMLGSEDDPAQTTGGMWSGVCWSWWCWYMFLRIYQVSLPSVGVSKIIHTQIYIRNGQVCNTFIITQLKLTLYSVFSDSVRSPINRGQNSWRANSGALSESRRT